MNIIDAVRYALVNNTNYHIQYNDNKINAITIVTHSINNFAKSEYNELNKVMVMTYCIYDQYKTKKLSNCWLCGFPNRTEYETIFGNYINLHAACFSTCNNARKNSIYESLSIFKKDDYHLLKYFNKYIVYNDKYLCYIFYKEYLYVPYPNVINDKNFHDEYRKWSLKFLVKQNIPKLLYYKKYLNHNDIFKCLMMTYAKVII